MVISMHMHALACRLFFSAAQPRLATQMMK